ncbi:MAG TPA: hypothetical protein PKE06_13790 [Flavilitoribacter sp.]|nr:hypothetical protein [Flavilitoribacter sp.]HMQ86472.1 hypothetical protein [Flavilitoribacter sp.]
MQNLLNPRWLVFLILSAFKFAWERLKYRFRKTNGRQQFTHTLPASTDSSAPFGE